MWGAIGSIGAGIVSAFGAHQRNQQAQAAARAQMKFQERTLRHGYQWATQDMKKAGINPMLAYQQGGSGGAGGATFVPENVGAAGAAGMELGSRAEQQSSMSKQQRTMERLARERQDLDLKQLEQHTALAKAQEDTQSFVQAREAAQASLASAQRLQAIEGALNTAADTNIKIQQLHSARAAASAARSDEEFYESDAGKLLRWIDRFGSSLNPMTRSTRDVR